MTKNLLFRADGSKNIGMGHLKRIWTIANYLECQHGFNAYFLLQNFPEAFSFFTYKKEKTATLPANCTLEEDIKRTLSLIGEINATALILDHLFLYRNDTYVDAIRNTKTWLITISDNSYYEKVNADLVLNGNPNQLKFSCQDEKTKYLLGPAYFIMDTQYASIPPFHLKEPNVPRPVILITLGGSDYNNLIFLLIRAMEQIKFDGSLLIISSRATGYIERLKKTLDKGKLQYHLKIDVESLYPFWTYCDLAVTAGGNSLFERIASGIPGATLCQLPRQLEIAEAFEKMDVNRNLGYGPEIHLDELTTNLQNFIEDSSHHFLQSINSRKTVDGKGLERFSNEILNLTE